jgi:hypothetical protein
LIAFSVLNELSGKESRDTRESVSLLCLLVLYYRHMIDGVEENAFAPELPDRQKKRGVL